MKKIALISCSKGKKNYSCKSMYMYDSVLFKKAKKYVESQNYCEWFILSAKHGLLNPENIIEPYDLTLNNMGRDNLIKWSNSVFIQLCQMNISVIDFYAGDNYRKYLIPLLEFENIECNIPLKGLGIGQQLQFYKNKEACV